MSLTTLQKSKEILIPILLSAAVWMCVEAARFFQSMNRQLQAMSGDLTHLSDAAGQMSQDLLLIREEFSELELKQVSDDLTGMLQTGAVLSKDLKRIREGVLAVQEQVLQWVPGTPLRMFQKRIPFLSPTESSDSVSEPPY